MSIGRPMERSESTQHAQTLYVLSTPMTVLLSVHSGSWEDRSSMWVQP